MCQFGGMYLDLDYVVLASLTEYRNTLLSNKQGSPRISVTNNAFSLSAHHRLLELAMRRLQSNYDPTCWNCIGPKLLTSALIQV